MPQIEIDNQLKEKITPHLQQMFNSTGNSAPLTNQFLYSELEENNDDLEYDPTLEENIKICPSVYRCYDERALLLVTNRCLAHCRFCTRRRIIDNPAYSITMDNIRYGLETIRKLPEIREIIISGGDPLVLSDTLLQEIFEKIEENRKIKVTRVDSRALTVHPARFTSSLIDILKRVSKLWFVSHFNNALEISDKTQEAVAKLLRAGIPILNQSVLLAGVNDTERDIIELNRKLVEIGVKPYYIYLCDKTMGTKRFQCEIRRALSILINSFGKLSGMEIPYIVYVGANGIKYRFTVNKNDTADSLLERIGKYVC